MTLEEAKELKKGDILNPSQQGINQNVFINAGKNADGTPIRYVITSIKTKKRYGFESIHIGIKRGLREFQSISETELYAFQKQQ